MAEAEPETPFEDRGGKAFPATHWSMVLKAGQRSGAQSAESLEILCRLYWKPLYEFIRRSGHDEETAKDLTQGFFARLIEKGDLGVVDPERGRFRSFLLAAVEHYLLND